jgi:ketosteroid isomerase-like protein
LNPRTSLLPTLAATLLASIATVAAAAPLVTDLPPKIPIAPSETTVSPPVAAVDAYHAALQAGDRKAVLNLLAADVIFYEQGFQEVSREAYGGAHLSADIDFAKGTRYEVIERKVLWLGDDAACVLTRFHQTGRFSGQAIDLVGTETDVLRRPDQSWIIKHIHTSAHPADQGKP